MWEMIIIFSVLAILALAIIKTVFYAIKRLQLNRLEESERTDIANRMVTLEFNRILRKASIIGLPALILLFGLCIYLFTTDLNTSSLAILLLIIAITVLLSLIALAIGLINDTSREIQRQLDNLTARNIGIESLIAYADSKAVHAQDKYILYRIKSGYGLDYKYLKMWNDSEKCWHYERVDPRCKTVQNALDYRHYGRMKRIDESHWIPETLT